jgi:uncharacterized membrane protein YkoI
MKSIATILISLVALASSPALAARQQQPPSPGNDSLGADWGAQQNEAREGVRHGRYAPLGQVIREINKRDPGYELDAGIEQQGGRAVYRVRWASSHGRRIDYIVDALSGAILRAQ